MKGNWTTDKLIALFASLLPTIVNTSKKEVSYLSGKRKQNNDLFIIILSGTSWRKILIYNKQIDPEGAKSGKNVLK